jgi:hypothetical protein
MEVKLTRGVTIAAASKEITQCMVDQRSPVACTALRVKGSVVAVAGPDRPPHGR